MRYAATRLHYKTMSTDSSLLSQNPSTEYVMALRARSIAPFDILVYFAVALFSVTMAGSFPASWIGVWRA